VESQVKERLVGAAVLVALGVWLIPWVLDGPSNSAVEPEPALELPAVGEAQPVRTRTVDLARTSPSAASADDTLAPQQAAAVVEPPSRSSTSAATPAGSESDRAAPNDTVRAGAPSATARAGGTNDASAGGNSAAASRASSTTAAGEAASASGRAAAAPGGAAATPRTAAAAGEWTVQLGSFSELANAQRLAERVATYGYTANVSDHVVGGRTLHRVRVGGYASRSEAEAANASLAAHGFVVQVVAPG
jgi:DedD protein